MADILVTGANGHLGRRLISALPDDIQVAALVRSERARRILLKHVGAKPQLKVTIADPCDAAAIAKVAGDCEQAIHLIGTIKETRSSRYVDAHERPARALADAVRQSAIKHIVTISILGADPTSPSKCLRSRAAVEEILYAAAIRVSVIRVPMVLGEKDRASLALAKRAAARRVILFRADSLEQPIYAGDVIHAMQSALKLPGRSKNYDLAGPESLSRRQLVTRAAAMMRRRPTIHSVPLGVGLAIASLCEWLSPRPPITREMLRILDHDDAIDPLPAADALDLKLTPLDEMLRRCISHRLA